MNGFINLYKPLNMSSSDAVLAVRKLLPRKTPVGHGGTLDPMAEGVLPVCVGKATRLFDYIVDKQKTYIAEICLGTVTDTDDGEGRVLETRPVDVSENDIRGVLERFTGDIMQVPPMYSALKKDGKPLYKLARQGVSMELEARKVKIFSIEYMCQSGENRHIIRINCGKGVYIRSLARDIGEALGCGAYMSALKRSKAGIFTAEEAVTIEKLREEGANAHLIEMDRPLTVLNAVYTSGDHREEILNGKPLSRDEYSGEGAVNERVKVYCGSEFAGIGTVLEDGCVHVGVMLLEHDLGLNA